MRRLPVASTVVVGLVVAAMICLGFWQLQRRAQKEALIASFAHNAALPEQPLPRSSFADALLFRHVRATCVDPAPPTRSAGRSVDGASGYRFITICEGGNSGPPFAVTLGVSPDPRLQARWPGGEVRGVLTRAPESMSFIERIFRKSPPPTPMIVPSEALAAGLAPSSPPDPSGVPNNHLAYAVQWFAFAVVASVIYLLALRRRSTDQVS